MIVNEQKPIEFINKCCCEVDYTILENAIKWYSPKPVARIKTIYLYGNYPAISIYEQKFHIHRLLMMFILGRELDSSEYVHHIDNNKLNAFVSNLIIQPSSEHQRITNQGRQQTTEHINKRIDATTKTRYGHSIYENQEWKQ